MSAVSDAFFVEFINVETVLAVAAKTALFVRVFVGEYATEVRVDQVTLFNGSFLWTVIR